MRQTFSEINYFFRRYLTPFAKWLLIINVGIFLLVFLILPLISLLIRSGNSSNLSRSFILLLAQIPAETLFHFQLWRLVTYAFLHADGMHLLFNMMVIWFMAPLLEVKLGTKRFLNFYLIVVIGAGLIHSLFCLFTHQMNQVMIGSSGGIFGILVAVAMYYPNQTILLNFLLPMKMKYFVIILLIIEFITTINTTFGDATSNISNITHLSGALIGFLLIKFYAYWDNRRWRKFRSSSKSTYRNYRDW